MTSSIFTSNQHLNKSTEDQSISSIIGLTKKISKLKSKNEKRYQEKLIVKNEMKDSQTTEYLFKGSKKTFLDLLFGSDCLNENSKHETIQLFQNHRVANNHALILKDEYLEACQVYFYQFLKYASKNDDLSHCFQYKLPKIVIELIKNFLFNENAFYQIKDISPQNSGYRTLITVPSTIETNQIDEERNSFNQNDEYILGFSSNIRYHNHYNQLSELFKEATHFEILKQNVLNKFQNIYQYPNEISHLTIVATFHFLRFQGYQFQFIGFPELLRNFIQQIQNNQIKIDSAIKQIDLLNQLLSFPALHLKAKRHCDSLYEQDLILLEKNEIKYFIGRNSDCQIKLMNPQVSRYHGYIQCIDYNGRKKWYMMDGIECLELKSAFGTWKVLQKQKLYSLMKKDVIQIGNQTIQIEFSELKT